MKKIIVLSDTHGNTKDLKKIAALLSECDYVFHLGDGANDLNAVAEEIKGKIVRVHGNCDLGPGDKELLLEIEGKKLFLTHGDLYGVKGSLHRLSLRARELGADAAFYGHNHKANIVEDAGLLLVNPGNMVRYSVDKSFCYCVIANGKITCAINRTLSTEI